MKKLIIAMLISSPIIISSKTNIAKADSTDVSTISTIDTQIISREDEPLSESYVEKNEENVQTGANSRYLLARKAITGWRIKTINGYVYKRMYNYSAEKWIGKWVRV